LVTYDECGHVSGIETKTLQLTSAANVNEEFRENIETNSKAIEDINKFLEENLPETYAKLSWTGELKDLVENTGDSTITSITSAIGSLSNLTKKLKEAWGDMYWDNYTKDISIYNIEQALADMVTALVKAYNDAVNARAAITGLTTRIDKIDAHLNINSN
jgi:CRISPR/Cas system-associated endonuclease Cas3-HD